MPCRLLTTSLLIMVLLLVAGCGLGAEPDIVGAYSPQTTALPRAVAEAMTSQPNNTLGAQVFSQNCTACHGVSGGGDGDSVMNGVIRGVPNFTDPSTMTASSPAELFVIITEGRLEKFMPPWGAVLSEEERWAVTMVVYSFSQTGSDARSAGR